MPDTTYIDNNTSAGNRVTAAWLNQVNRLVNDLAANSLVTQGDALVPVKRTAPGALATTQHAWHEAQHYNAVSDFGIDPTGVADATTKLRDACNSIGAMTSAMARRAVYLPPGKYKITDTIYIRAGCCLYGSGMCSFIDASGFPVGGTEPVFRLGWGLVSGVPTKDTLVGDQPSEICNLFVLGGPAGGGAVVDVDFAGALVHDIWTSASGKAFKLKGGYIYDCEVDLGLVGMEIVGGTNQTVTNVRFFNQNYALQFTGTDGTSDCTLTGLTIEYPKIAGIDFPGSNFRGMKFVGSKFITNEQFAGLVGAMLVGGANNEITLDDPHWSNTKGAGLYVQGPTNVVTLNAPVFEGLKANAAYAQSTTAAGIKVQGGRVLVNNAVFRNLSSYALQVGGLAAACTVEIDGATIYNSAGALANDIQIDSTVATQDTIELRNVKGSGKKLFNLNSFCLPRCRNLQDWLTLAVSGSRRYVDVPITRGGLILFTLRANVNVGGNGTYGKTRAKLIEKENDFVAGPILTTYLNVSDLHAGIAHSNGLLDILAEINSVGGGVSVTPINDSMHIRIHWPSSYAQEVIDCQYLVS